MPIEPHRIEAAARALMSDWGSIDAPSSRELEYAIDYAERILTAGFPELAAGTAWVAPWEATKAMRAALVEASYEEIIEGTTIKRLRERTFAAMRDAHLSKGKDDDHG